MSLAEGPVTGLKPKGKEELNEEPATLERKAELNRWMLWLPKKTDEATGKSSLPCRERLFPSLFHSQPALLRAGPSFSSFPWAQISESRMALEEAGRREEKEARKRKTAGPAEGREMNLQGPGCLRETVFAAPGRTGLSAPTPPG